MAATTSSSDSAAKLLSIPGEHRFRAENLPFGIDVWYRRLASVTFPTVFSPLSRQEGQAIVAYYQTRFNGRPRLTAEHVGVLLELECRLDALIAQHFPAGSGGAFMRLSDRSPKDADPLDRLAVWRDYQQALDGLRAEPAASCRGRVADVDDDTDDGNLKMQAIGKVNFLRVRNGAEAMSLLLTSERVFSDCHDWLSYGEPVMAAFRAFEPELTLENEFRAFVHQHKLTAISQYDHYTFYPQLEARKAHIGRLVYAEWQRIHPLVGEESYCVDFGYLPSRDAVVMIEISPFLPCTGPACFSWKDDADVLQAAPPDGAYEFRTVQAPRRGLNHVIESNWDQRWLSTDARYFEIYADYLPRPQPAAANSKSVVDKLLGWLGVLADDDSQHSQPELPGRIADAGVWQATGRQQYRAVFRRPDDASAQRNLLFVYGTLKRGFHWNDKFLFRAGYVSAARTVEPFPLVVGDCGVPYLLGDQPGVGHQIVGQLYRVDDELLAGMDDYEGITKGYYERRSIDVVVADDESVVQAWVYLLPRSDDKLRALPTVPEYTQAIHDERYLPIRHIQIKQQRYLYGSLEQYSIKH